VDLARLEQRAEDQRKRSKNFEPRLGEKPFRPRNNMPEYAVAGSIDLFKTNSVETILFSFLIQKHYGP